MAFAMVKFPNEETFSEVPKSWLEGENNCWWPSTKAVTTYISKMIPPNKTDGKWKLYPVDIIENDCDYERARKKADHSSSSSCSDFELGKGKRKKRIRQKSVDSTVSFSSSDNDDNRKVLEDIPEYSEKYPGGYEDGTTDSGNDQQSAGIALHHSVFHKQNIPSVSTGPDLSSSTIQNAGGADKENVIQFVDNSQQNAIQIVDNPNNGEKYHTSVVNIASEQQLNEIKNFVKAEFEKIHKSITKLTMMMEKLPSNMDDFSAANKNEDLNNLMQLFPLRNIDTLQEIEARLNEKSLYENLVKYLKTIGGSNTKDKVLRILRRLFANELVAKSSWLGKSRGETHNFQISKLIIIQACKDAVSCSKDYNEKLFEDVASDWIRQGKQRRQRELVKEAI